MFQNFSESESEQEQESYSVEQEWSRSLKKVTPFISGASQLSLLHKRFKIV